MLPILAPDHVRQMTATLKMGDPVWTSRFLHVFLRQIAQATHRSSPRSIQPISILPESAPINGNDPTKFCLQIADAR